MTKRGDQFRGAGRTEGPVTGYVEPARAEAARDDFLRAVASARQVELQHQQRAARVRRSLLAAAAAVLMLATGLSLGMLLFFRPVQAEPFAGMQGVVLSSYDRRPLSGVQIYGVAAGGALGQQPLAVTDAAGGFLIPAAVEGAPGELKLYYDGEDLGQSIKLGPQELASRGFKKIYVDVPAARRRSELPASLQAGQRESLSGNLALSAAAEQGWKGKLIVDGNWPACFAFAQIAGGIYELQLNEAAQAASQAPAVRLHVRVDQQVLRTYFAQPQDLRLLARSSEYEMRERGDKQTRWRSYYHRGWYYAEQPPAQYLPVTQLRIDESSSDAESPANQPLSSASAGPGAWVSWDAQPGVQYALAVPFSRDGEISACCLCSPGSDGKYITARGIRLLDRQRTQPLVYDVMWYDQQYDSYYFEPAYMSNFVNEHYFADEVFPRGHLNGDLGVRQIGADEYRKLAEPYWLRQFDFTLDENKAISYGPLKVDYSRRPDAYSVQVDHAGVGSVAKLKVAGDLSKLAERPAWYFLGDPTPYAWGETAELLISHAGTYKVQAVLKETDGNVVIVDQQIVIPGEGIIGYVNNGSEMMPYIAGAAAPLAETSRRRILSPLSVATPAAFGSIASGWAGPYVYVELPAEFHDTPLHEGRITLYASPRGGDTDLIPLMPSIEPVKPTGDPVYPYQLCDEFLPDQETPDRLVLTLLSYYTHRALQIDTGGETATPMELLDEYCNLPSHLGQLQYVLGLDPAHLPTNAEMLEIFERFAQSPYYLWRCATEEKQELKWAIDLRGGVLPAAAGLRVGIKLEDQNYLLAGQWDLYSGGSCLSRVEIESADGRVYTTYIDYSRLSDSEREQ